MGGYNTNTSFWDELAGRDVPRGRKLFRAGLTASPEPNETNNTNTLYTMKTKIFKAVLTAACLTGIILAGAENPDGSCNLLWTLGWLAIAAASGFGIKKMEDAK